MATGAFGGLLQRATQVVAQLLTGVVGSNNAITWRAVSEGVAGNSVTLTLVDPGTTASLSVVVTGTAIVVNLAYATGAITSTAAEVIAAVNADNDAGALVIVHNTTTSTGAGLMTALVLTSLAGGAADVTYTTIANVVNFSGPSLSLATIDSTHMESTAAYREHIAGLLDAGEVSFDLNFLPTNATQNHILGLIKDIKHKKLRTFKEIFTDSASTEWTFTAWVTGFTPGGTIDGKLAANVTVKISGQPTLA